MAEVIQLESFKRKQAANRGFRSWSKRFGEELNERTKLSDLSDTTLVFLISPGDENIFVLYELVMGTRDLGTASDFFHLDKDAKMEVIDVSIYLLDQLRFESMRRLGWLESGYEQRSPIVELVEQHSHLGQQRRATIPPLSPSHPRYKPYQKLPDFDKETFVRKLIPEAIEQFKARIRD
jgi:hypothetical protein